MIIPDYYTSKEGGEWKPWPQDAHVKARSFHIRDKHYVTICRRKVHSFLFGNIRSKEGFYIRWDCINGFNPEVY